MHIQPPIPFDNTFASEMEGFYVVLPGEQAPSPKIVQFNKELADELGLDATALNTDDGALIFSGSKMPEGAASLAQVYAGHQFGGFSPQLGDGRALLVGEIIDTKGKRRDIQLKGSGRTPFSRGGDGKAVLAPVLREYLMGEAMHALGIPTTRALAAVVTGENVLREDVEKGAVLTRVASSHMRVGTFQFFAARGETGKVQQLADYAIKRHYQALAQDENPYLGLLKKVIEIQASLVAKWVSVGFVHGVMNTDNMTISGETIDYGPCAFMDHYEPKAVFSSIDTHGRYAYGNQPVIAQWNLARFAETLVPLVNPDNTDDAVAVATEALNAFPQIYFEKWLAEMRLKLGLVDERDEDAELVNRFHKLMEGKRVDYTQSFRHLADAARGNTDAFFGMFCGGEDVKGWLKQWLERLSDKDGEPSQQADAMDRVNPIYVPRNHKVEEALEAARRDDDYAPFDELLGVLKKPYEKRAGFSDYENPAPDGFGPYTTYCGT